MKALRAVCLAGVALVSCIRGGTDDPPTPPPPTPGTITVENAASVAFDEVYAEPDAAQVTFTNLRNTSSVPPGASLAITGLAPGAWFVAVANGSTGTDYIAIAEGVTVQAGQGAWVTFTDAGFAGRMDVTNGGTSNVTAIYATPAGMTPRLDRNWADAPIAPGETALLRLYFWAGSYDIRCDFSGGGSSVVTYAAQPLTITHVVCG